MSIEFTKGVNKSVDVNTVAKGVGKEEFLKSLKGNDKDMASIFNKYDEDGSESLDAQELTKAMEELQKAASGDKKISGKEAKEYAANKDFGKGVSRKDIKNFWSAMNNFIKEQDPLNKVGNTYDANGALETQTETDKDENVIVTAYSNGKVATRTTKSADGNTVIFEEGDKKTVTVTSGDNKSVSEFEKGNPVKTTTTTDKNKTVDTFDSDGSLQKKVLTEGGKTVTTDYDGAKGSEKITDETVVEGKKTTVKKYDDKGGYIQTIKENEKADVVTKHDKEGKPIGEKPATVETPVETKRTLVEVQKEINQKLKASEGKWTSDLNALVAERTELRKGALTNNAEKTHLTEHRYVSKYTEVKDRNGSPTSRKGTMYSPDGKTAQYTFADVINADGTYTRTVTFADKSKGKQVVKYGANRRETEKIVYTTSSFGGYSKTVGTVTTYHQGSGSEIDKAIYEALAKTK